LIPHNGYLTVPQGNGLGIEADEDKIKEIQVKMLKEKSSHNAAF